MKLIKINMHVTIAVRNYRGRYPIRYDYSCGDYTFLTIIYEDTRHFSRRIYNKE